MIVSFSCKETKRIFEGFFSKKFPAEIQRIALKRLIHLNIAKNLKDLQIPPGNRLHALSGNRKGGYSISINDQWRICFNFEVGKAYNVEIVDYH